MQSGIQSEHVSNLHQPNNHGRHTSVVKGKCAIRFSILLVRISEFLYANFSSTCVRISSEACMSTSSKSGWHRLTIVLIWRGNLVWFSIWSGEGGGRRRYLLADMVRPDHIWVGIKSAATMKTISGYNINFRWECAAQSWKPFQTKIYDFPYPTSDSQNVYPLSDPVGLQLKTGF